MTETNEGTSPMSKAVFISYSHKDKKALERLQIHLKQYERRGMVETWDDTRIPPGGHWYESIEQSMSAAKVAVLLISADFFASEFIANHELPRLLEAAKNRGVVILPVVLKPCNYHESELAKFQALNDASRPVSAMTAHQKEALWAKVASEIHRALADRIPPGDLEEIEEDFDGQFESAKALYVDAHYDEAAALLESLLNTQPGQLDILTKLGQAYEKLNRPIDCIKIADRILAIDPKHIGALNAKSHALFALGREEEANEIHLFAYNLDDDSYFGGAWEKGPNDLTRKESRLLDAALIDSIEAEARESFTVHHTGHSNQISVRTQRQFVLVAARYGGIESYMLDVLKEILADVQHVQDSLTNKEYLRLRGVFFDDGHGELTLYIDLLNDISIEPSLTEADIRELFHDDYTWYGSQGISVSPTITSVVTDSDSFFSLADEYYETARSGLYWK